MIIVDMPFHTPDDIEQILKDDEENDYSKTDSSGAQETSWTLTSISITFCWSFRTLKALGF